MVGVSAGERYIVKVFPEEIIKFKSSSIMLLVFVGIELEGRHILGKQPPKTALYLLVKSKGGRNIG